VSMVLDLDELVERVAVRVAELLVDRMPAPADSSPWLNVEEAAEYMRCKPKRVYDLVSQRRLRAHRDGSRLLLHRDDLDAYLLEGDGAADSVSVRRSRTPAATGNSESVSARSQRAARARTP
jgi:excisionase family DNA binding protein